MANLRTAYPQFTILIAMIACAALFLSTAAQAQTSEADKTQFKEIITSQIEAFRRDDAVAAYYHAAPTIKGVFGTPDRFLEMVKTGYLPVYRARDFSFGPVTNENGRPTQHVDITGPEGNSWVAKYTMQRQADGTWRISGVILLKPEGESV